MRTTELIIIGLCGYNSRSKRLNLSMKNQKLIGNMENPSSWLRYDKNQDGVDELKLCLAREDCEMLFGWDHCLHWLFDFVSPRFAEKKDVYRLTFNTHSTLCLRSVDPRPKYSSNK